jgi:hypothetical protein
VRQRYRVVVECDVETIDMTPERMREIQEEREQHMLECEACRLAGPEEPSSDESIAEQRLLRQQLLQDPQALDRWMVREVRLQLAEQGLEEAAPTTENEEDILKPVIERLPPVLRHRFREALARGELYESAAEFYESFTVEIAGVRVERA